MYYENFSFTFTELGFKGNSKLLQPPGASIIKTNLDTSYHKAQCFKSSFCTVLLTSSDKVLFVTLHRTLSHFIEILFYSLLHFIGLRYTSQRFLYNFCYTSQSFVTLHRVFCYTSQSSCYTSQRISCYKFVTFLEPCLPLPLVSCLGRLPYLFPCLASYHAFILSLPRLATCHVLRLRPKTLTI